MPLFQIQVERQYLESLTTNLKPLYEKHLAYFGNAGIQANILQVSEEQYQGEFIRALFVDILGYTAQPELNFNLLREKKNETDSKSADAAIIVNNQIVAVIELKDHKTQDLKKVEAQAFGYKNNHRNCRYVVTSNFERLRFYIENAVEFIEFDLFNLTFDDFRRLWLCLSYDSIARDLPVEIKKQSVSSEDIITKKLYKDYSVFKRMLFDNMVALNPGYDKLLLFKKTQKLLDRFLFLFFAEDKGLLPANSVKSTLDKWVKYNADPMNDYRPLYSRFVRYFRLLDEGYKDANIEIYAYNGGLFANDELLNDIRIDDTVLSDNILKLATYDYATDVDVNILGHIFENSLNELEEVANEISTGQKVPSKRKQDGVFYTPRYITKYIVESTLGRLCEEKKTELGIGEELFEYKRKDKRKEALKVFDNYREWLLQITIVDPACGSGAFLNMALEFLMAEHEWIDAQQDKIAGLNSHYSMGLSNIENTILENNLFGVDINDESVEIAKLSLWLRTAKPHRKLNSLNNNIKCGNSLIDDPAVAGDKAFNWQKEFPQVYRKKNKKAWHITTATHNSRYSQRMFDNHVKLGEPVWLTPADEEIITRTVAGIVEADKLNVLAYNICGDHMHLALVCEEEEVPTIVGKLKSMSARAANIAGGRTSTRGHAPLSQHTTSPTATAESVPRGETQTPLWTQKYGCKEITSEEQLYNTIAYIRNNRRKHGLPELGDSPDSPGFSSTGTFATVPSFSSFPTFPTFPSFPSFPDKGACPLVDSSGVENTGVENTGVENTGVDSSGVGKLPVGKIPADIPGFYPRTVSPGEAFRTEYTGGFDVVIGNPPYVQLQSMVEMSEALKTCGYETFDKGADLYCLFTERGYKLLKKGGLQSFIMPNKWMLVAYGKPLRKFLSRTGLQQVLNFGDIQFFQEATTYVCIFVTQKSRMPGQVQVLSLNRKSYKGDFLSEVQTNIYEYPAVNFTDNEWSIQPYEDAVKLAKMKQNGTELKDLPVSINYGIKTGYNEAFFINEETRKQLIAADPRSEEIIKPMVRGRDISAYEITDFEYLIGTFPALKLDIDHYPALKEHLLSFGYDRLKQTGESGARKKTSGKWFETQDSIGYYKEFAKPKIIYPNMTSVFPFMYDESGFLSNDKSFVLTTQDDSVSLLYLTAVFNSSLAKLWIWYNCPELQGGTREIRKVYFEHFPVPQADYGQTKQLEELAGNRAAYTNKLQLHTSKFQRMIQRKFELEDLPGKLQNWYTLTFKEFVTELGKKKIKLTLAHEAEWEDYFAAEQAKALEIKNQIDATDREIDRMVYGLYGLTEEEVGIVEGVKYNI